MTIVSLTRAIPVALAGLLALSPAFAQTASGSAAAEQAPSHAVVERRIAELHKRLQVTAPEQPVFDQFAEVMRNNATRMNALVQSRRKDITAMTAVDQMKGYQEVAQAHAEDMQRLVAAFEKLYDALTPEQKKMADTSFRQFAKSGRS